MVGDEKRDFNINENIWSGRDFTEKLLYTIGYIIMGVSFLSAFYSFISKEKWDILLYIAISLFISGSFIFAFARIITYLRICGERLLLAMGAAERAELHSPSHAEQMLEGEVSHAEDILGVEAIVFNDGGVLRAGVPYRNIGLAKVAAKEGEARSQS